MSVGDRAVGAMASAGSATPQAVAGQYVISGCAVSAPTPRMWAVNLSSWSSQAIAGLGPCALAQSRVRLTFGSGGDAGAANDIVDVDYPAQGTVFGVHAQSLRVDFVGRIASLDISGQRRPPPLGVWVTPSVPSQRPMTATLTEDNALVDSVTTNVYAVPPRARAYRILVISGVAIVNASVLTANATPLTVQTDRLWDAAANEYRVPSERWSWFPLHPLAGSLNVSTGANSLEYVVQWLLELG